METGNSNISDAISMLIAQRDGTCPDATVSLTGAKDDFILTKGLDDLNEEDIIYLEKILNQLDLTSEEEAAFRALIYKESSANTLPKSFSLSQNHPNPFNPTTTINYTVPEGRDVHVTLKVYDLRGRGISTLVDEDKESGTYNVYWNGLDYLGNSVSSGVYFYRISAGDFVQTRKMVLLK